MGGWKCRECGKWWDPSSPTPEDAKLHDREVHPDRVFWANEQGPPSDEDMAYLYKSLGVEP